MGKLYIETTLTYCNSQCMLSVSYGTTKTHPSPFCLFKHFDSCNADVCIDCILLMTHML